jgi:hypothetical protein
MLDTYEMSAGLFARTLTNLQVLLRKAERHAAGDPAVEASILGASLAVEGSSVVPPGSGAYDLHGYTLAAQIHWAAEGARLSIARLLGEETNRVFPSDEPQSFRDLQGHLDSTIAYLKEVSHSDLETGLDGEVVIEHRGGSTHGNGARFLSGYAIPHFHYHVVSAYTILRNQGVQLRMSDFLGDWGAD